MDVIRIIDQSTFLAFIRNNIDLLDLEKEVGGMRDIDSEKIDFIPISFTKNTSNIELKVMILFQVKLPGACFAGNVEQYNVEKLISFDSITQKVSYINT